MSTEFVALRARARDKRDKAIAEIRRDYEAALVQIAALEQDLLGKVSSRHKKISSAIESVIPSDRTFTTLDILTALEALDPRRVWRKRSIDYVLTALRRKGLIRRLKRATIHERASYVRAGAPAAEPPLADMTLFQVIGQVLTRPMTTTEVVVAALEAGYQTTMEKRNLRVHVNKLLARGFKLESGKWQP
jgi:hypothetical protein